MPLDASTRVLDCALHFRDAYTAGHCARVEWLAVELGRRCGLARTELDVLLSVSRLHDVGKIGVPDAILLKPGALDADEWTVMRTHPVIGEQLCAVLEHENVEHVARAVRHHHESWNGDGYPDGLNGEAIPICSRVTACADAYDAMTTRRVHQKARTHADAVGVICDDRGLRLDPWVTDRFLRFVEEADTRARLEHDRRSSPHDGAP